MKWSLFNWKKPAVSSGEPEDYQVVKNTVNQNTTNIRDLNNQVHLVQGSTDRNGQSINNINTQLANTVSTNTAQTITGAKTFTNEVVISKNPTPLILKANNNDKTYMLIKSSDNNTNFSLGANSRETSLEVNRGNLILKTLQSNKNVAFENVAKVKLNRSVLECGTKINAGYGGGVVKFIPEDNSTKTLQFFNNNNNDTRRFNLKVAEPTEATNPATKNYVDTKTTETRNYVDTQINGINMVNSINYQNVILTNQSSSSFTTVNFGPFVKHTLKLKAQANVEVLSAVAEFTDTGGGTLNADLDFTYSVDFFSRYIYLNFKYVGNTSSTPNWQFSIVRIWYISSGSSRIIDPFVVVSQEANNEN